jgi:plasmid maintenance system antidote protein VapI
MKNPIFDLWVHVFERLEGDQQRLAAVLVVAMLERRETAASIARRHHLSRWYVTAVVKGKRNLSPKMRAVFEADLELDLSPFAHLQTRGDVDNGSAELLP